MGDLQDFSPPLLAQLSKACALLLVFKSNHDSLSAAVFYRLYPGTSAKLHNFGISRDPRITYFLVLEHVGRHVLCAHSEQWSSATCARQ